MDADISKRIWVTRYLMIVGIIVLHLPPSQPLSDINGSLFEYVRAFFTHGVFRATVPVLTAVSGYLIFRSGLHLNPIKLLNKKTSTILVPLLMWNIPLVFAVYLVQKFGLLEHGFSAQLYPINIMSWVNATIGLTGTPVNYPLNFLRDLFVISLLSPILWQLLKRIPYIGLIVILIVYYFNLDGSVFLRNSMLVSFYIGALAATQKWDMTYFDNYSKLFFGVFIGVCLLIVVFKIENRELFRLVSPILVWPSMFFIANSKLGDLMYRYAKCSFFTFLAHGPIILILWIGFGKLPSTLPYFYFWILAPILTVLLTGWLSIKFKQWMPAFSSFMLGGR